MTENTSPDFKCFIFCWDAAEGQMTIKQFVGLAEIRQDIVVSRIVEKALALVIKTGISLYSKRQCLVYTASVGK